MKQFDVVVANPPFQDRARRGRTPHKLWIEFTVASLTRMLKPGGLLLQVSPASFRSPSSKVLPLMRSLTTETIDFDVAEFFPGIGSTFASYAVRNSPRPPRHSTRITQDGATFQVKLAGNVAWLPNDLCPESLSIHRKVMFEPTGKLAVEHDYVTNHNALLREGGTLSRSPSRTHTRRLFHTNTQFWWSSADQPCASQRKVMWTRSGYTKPFYDPGTLGATDMVYFVRVATDAEGERLAHNLNLPLMRYIFKTARWSGFGNEVVFQALPALPADRALTSEEINRLFRLTGKEAAHVRRAVG